MAREGKAPAFQFYAKDYLSDEEVSLMTLAEQGAYVRLLCHEWHEGSIPADHESLARLLHISVQELDQMWTRIGARFVAGADADRLVNRRMEEERRKLSAYAKSRKRNALHRWHKDESKPCTCNAHADHMQCSASASAIASASNKDRPASGTPRIEGQGQPLKLTPPPAQTTPPPKQDPPPLPFQPDEAVRAVADAARERFIVPAGALEKGHKIALNRLIREFGDIGDWRTFGAWLHAGGGWIRPADIAWLCGNFKRLLNGAREWHRNGRGPVQATGRRDVGEPAPRPRVPDRTEEVRAMMDRLAAAKRVAE